jgi:hypothetical protein
MEYYVKIDKDNLIIGYMANNGPKKPEGWIRIPSPIYGFRDLRGNPRYRLVNGSPMDIKQ